MTDLIFYTLVCGALLVAFATYKAKTAHMALYAREKMAQMVQDILQDEDLPHELKEMAVTAFHLSAKSTFLPGAVIDSFKNRPENALHLSNDHQRLLDSLIRDHLFKVNMLAAPHWYALFGVLFFLIAVISIIFSLGWKSGYSFLSRIERAVERPLLYKELT